MWRKCWMQMMGTGNKVENLMKYLGQKFSETGDLGLKASEGHFLRKACRFQDNPSALSTMPRKVARWESRWKGLGVYGCQVLDNKSVFQGRLELMGAAHIYLIELKIWIVYHLLDGLEPNVVCHLYRRFRNMSCYTCSCSIATTQSSVDVSSCHRLAGLKLGEVDGEIGCELNTNAVLCFTGSWCIEIRGWETSESFEGHCRMLLEKYDSWDF